VKKKKCEENLLKWQKFLHKLEKKMNKFNIGQKVYYLKNKESVEEVIIKLIINHNNYIYYISEENIDFLTRPLIYQMKELFKIEDLIKVGKLESDLSLDKNALKRQALLNKKERLLKTKEYWQAQLDRINAEIDEENK